MSYADFIASKVRQFEDVGLANVPRLNRMLFDFQKDLVRWALRKGRAALFCDCGLGKTPMQLEWARHVPGPVLILAPLAVSQQTIREGQKFGIDLGYAKTQADVTKKITITNYENLAKFDCSTFEGVVLDESSILKNFMGKTKQLLVESFARTRYRLACTATPAPNDYMEMGNHADFLGIMPANEMLSRWFINDTMHFGNYRLKKYAVEDFWRWVASWAACVSKPSDLGYPDDGFVLPALSLREVVVPVDHSQGTDGKLFRNSALYGHVDAL